MFILSSVEEKMARVRVSSSMVNRIIPTALLKRPKFFSSQVVWEAMTAQSSNFPVWLAGSCRVSLPSASTFAVMAEG